MLDMVLTMNNFRFDGNHYLQTAGTAMGTRVAPTYANIFMSDFEERHVYTYPKQPTLWRRFIDDIFLIWEHGAESLKMFIHHLNNVHPTIKFTAECSVTKVNFLDTWVINHDGSIVTDLYNKPTDSSNYLLYTSAHPMHCKRGIPFSQYLRIRRICSETSDFIKHSIEKGRHFIRRGYPLDLVVDSFTKALHKQRSVLLAAPKVEPDKEPANILVSTYNPGFRGIQTLVTKNWDLLGKSSSTRDIYKTKLIMAWRKPKNLKSILVRAKLPKVRETVTDMGTPANPCKTKTCRYCPKLNKTGRITCSASHRSYITKHNVTCKSSNLIYCITCNKCAIQYVGQTKNRLMDRFQAHFYSIAHNKANTEVGKHFNLPDHTGLDNVEIYVVDFIHAEPAGKKSKYLRDLIEFNWIQRMHSNAPTGLNVMDPM